MVETKILDHPQPLKMVGLVVFIVLLGGVGGALVNGRLGVVENVLTAREETTPDPIPSPEIKTVTGLGYLEPQGEVISVSASSSPTQGNRVEQLLVKEGDWVEAGQAIAILDSRDRFLAQVNEAENQVKITQAKLTRVQAGAQQGDIEAQQAVMGRIEAERRTQLAAQTAEMSRLQLELDNAKTEFERYQFLYNEGAISASERDNRKLGVDRLLQQLKQAEAERERITATHEEQLREAQARLAKITEVRPVDIEVARAEVNAAQASVARAKTDLDQAYVRSPQGGKVLDIHTHPGETIAPEGILALGQTQQMYAIAEIYESDIDNVKPGQPAVITSDALTEELQGTVEQIGLQVQRQNVINTDPAANTDARVVEVKVRLDQASSQKVWGLTHLQVTVTINIGHRSSVISK